MKRNNSDLFYTCSLIEYIGRECELKRSDVVDGLGKDIIKRIYKYADTFHSEIIETVADNFITMTELAKGNFDNVSKCRYEVPDYWTIGEVYERLIEDVCDDEDKVIDVLVDVYHSWISDAISNYNSDFYYQSREYIALCYQENKIL